MSTQNRGHLIRVTKASFDTINHLAAIEKCPKAEIVRRALDAYGHVDTSVKPVRAETIARVPATSHDRSRKSESASVTSKASRTVLRLGATGTIARSNPDGPMDESFWERREREKREEKARQR